MVYVCLVVVIESVSEMTGYNYKGSIMSQCVLARLENIWFMEKEKTSYV